MATNFPSSLDNFTNPVSGNTLDSPSHSLQHSDANDAIEAIEAKLGVGASPAGSATAGDVLTISSAGTSAWTTAGQAFKNLIINGDMQVTQRGTSVASITSGGYKTVDRWDTVYVSLGTWTQSVENDGPSGSGFAKSLKWLCTTADASPATGDALYFFTKLEGQNLQQILKGTSAAKQLTLSFWVKSNVTGTYIAELNDADNSRTVSASYTISTSGTWEKKTITFPADTIGVLNNDNGSSLEVDFWLGAGTDFTSGSLQTTWGTATNSKRAVGQTNLAAATNNYWQITGVQLEVGSIATGFEFLPYDQNLQRCQRYYYRSGGNDYTNHTVGGASLTTRMFGLVICPVTMRTAPTSLEFSSVAAANYGGGLQTITAMSLELTGRDKILVYGTVASGLLANVPGAILNGGNSAGYLAVSSEL